MATTTKKVDAARPVARDARGVSESASLEFLVFEDNGGGYHWAIVGGSDEWLAQSGGFGGYEEAAHAGRYARDGAEAAQFERRPVSSSGEEGRFSTTSGMLNGTQGGGY